MKKITNNKYIKIGIIVLPIVVILATVFIIFINSPRYSLLQVRKAVVSRNYEKFSKYVNTTSVISNAINDYTSSTDSEYSDLVSLIAQSMSSTLVSTIQNSVQDGSFGSGWMGSISLFSPLKIERHGDDATVTAQTSGGDMSFSMKKVGLHWEIYKFNNLKELNLSNEEDKTSTQIINKSIGDEIELATISFTVNSFEKISSVSQSFGDDITASEGKSLYKMNVSVKNISDSNISVGSDMFILADSNSYQYEIIDDSLWVSDNSLYGENILPSLVKQGNLIYEIPDTSTGIYLTIGKSGTNEVYHVELLK